MEDTFPHSELTTDAWLSPAVKSSYSSRSIKVSRGVSPERRLSSMRRERRVADRLPSEQGATEQKQEGPAVMNLCSMRHCHRVADRISKNGKKDENIVTNRF